MIDRITEQPFNQTRDMRSVLVNADCFDVFPFIDNKTVNLILCDLPYGTTWQKWDSVLDMKKLWQEYNRIISDNGAIVLFSSQPFTTELINSNIKNFKYTWYWIKDNKGNYLNAKYQPLRQVEEINVFNKHNYYPQGLRDYNKGRCRGSSAKITLMNYSDSWVQEKTGYPSNVLNYGLDRTGLHPTAKPLELIKYLIKTYTKEDDVVMDNCMGSNTTGLACKELNRQYIGIEKDKHYYDVSVNRVQS
jgi:site-specific DNA-methyltransferase (adenine-specific)